MKKPVRKRFAEGGEIIDVDKAADTYRKVQPGFHDYLNVRRRDREPNDPMVAYSAGSRTKDRMKEIETSPQAIDRPKEVSMARGGKIKVVSKVTKGKRR